MNAKINKSTAWLWLLSLVFLLPFVALLWQAGTPEAEVWQHLSSTVLPVYLQQSLWLLLGVGLGTLLLGVSTAWLVARHEFPGHRHWQWLLILPMAMPGYIVAYAYTWWLDVAGPLQTSLREQFDWSFGEYWFPNIRSFGGAVMVLTLVLYPYVYLLSRAAFQKLSKRMWEAHQLAGGQHFFRRIALPLARPAIFGGLALVMMETLADYGTVQFFGINTLTTGIFKTWFGLGSLSGAAQIACLLLGLVLLIMGLEKIRRGAARFDAVNDGLPTTQKTPLVGWRAWLSCLWCALVVSLGFVLPLLLLIMMAGQSQISQWWTDFTTLIFNTFWVAGLATLITVGVALLTQYVNRHSRHRPTKNLIKSLALGYAIPGLVIAVGVSMAYGWLDQSINWLLSSFTETPARLIFSGGFIALITAYVMRFLAVAMKPLDAAYQGISQTYDEASLLTGKSNRQTFQVIHWPLLKSSLWTAALLVFVDLLKELPATLVLRPFNFNTLAVKAYELAADERLADAAIPALCIVAVGLLPVLMLNKRINHAHDNHP